VIGVNDEVPRDGDIPLLEIPVTASPLLESLKMSSRYVAFGLTLKVEVVLELTWRLSVVLATEVVVNATVSAIPLPQLLLDGALLASPL
jgi:hypothetical protein